MVKLLHIQWCICRLVRVDLEGAQQARATPKIMISNTIFFITMFYRGLKIYNNVIKSYLKYEIFWEAIARPYIPFVSFDKYKPMFK